MPLLSITTSNYRSFIEPARIELRPLTLLFGYNNSGKSALARLLPLLGDSISNRPSPPLNLASPAVRGGGFEDLRSKQTGGRTLGLGLTWEGEHALNLQLSLQDLPERRQHVVGEFELKGDDSRLLRGTWKLPEEGVLGLPTFYTLTSPGEPSYEAKVEWHGLVPHGLVSPSHQELFNKLDLSLRELLSTLWVGAIRKTPPRVNPPPGQMPERLGHDGEGAWDALAWDKAAGGPLLPKVARWYAAHADTLIDVQLSTQSYALVVGPQQVNLVDTGEGLSQVMPVLVAGALAEQQARQRPSYLVVEQPELHLHPAAHAPLAGYFCDIAQQQPALRTLIETHSENFLFGVQLAVAKGELSSESVLIYWVRQNQGRSSLTRITLDELGRPDNWPRGVFSEETELAGQLLEAREQRGYR